MLARACSSVWGEGETHTHTHTHTITQDMREKGVCVSRRGGEERRFASSLCLTSERRDIEKLAGSQRE